MEGLGLKTVGGGKAEYAQVEGEWEGGSESGSGEALLDVPKWKAQEAGGWMVRMGKS